MTDDGGSDGWGRIEQTLSHACQACGTAFEEETVACPACRRLRPLEGWRAVRDMPDRFLGRKIGGSYILTRRVGRGASGSVYLARSPYTSDTYAAKLVDLSAASTQPDIEMLAERLDSEVAILARVRSPHVIEFYDVIELPGSAIAIITEYVDGHTLEELLDASGGISQRRAVELTRQVAIGLDEVHRLGAVHRDLKPANIMIQALHRDDEFAHVIDFGIVHVDGGPAETVGFIGTPLYASPEQARGESIGHLSDIYSLGAVLYAMLTGTPPFEESTSEAALTKHAFEVAPSVTDTRPDLEYEAGIVELVSAMLEKEPSDRPASMARVADRLSEIAWELDDGVGSGEETAEGGDSVRLSRRPPENPLRAVSPTGGVVYVDGGHLRWRPHFADDAERNLWAPNVPVTALAFGADGLLSGHGDGTVSRLSLPEGRLDSARRDRQLAPVSSLAEDEEGRLLCIGSTNGHVCCGLGDGATREWDDLPSGPPVSAVAVDAASTSVAVARTDGTTTILQQSHDDWDVEIVIDQTATPHTLRFSPDGYLLAAYGADSDLVIYNTATGQAVSRRPSCPIEAGLVFAGADEFDCAPTCLGRGRCGDGCAWLPQLG